MCIFVQKVHAPRSVPSQGDLRSGRSAISFRLTVDVPLGCYYVTVCEDINASPLTFGVNILYTVLVMHRSLVPSDVPTMRGKNYEVQLRMADVSIGYIFHVSNYIDRIVKPEKVEYLCHLGGIRLFENIEALSLLLMKIACCESPRHRIVCGVNDLKRRRAKMLSERHNSSAFPELFGLHL